MQGPSVCSQTQIIPPWITLLQFAATSLLLQCLFTLSETPGPFLKLSNKLSNTPELLQSAKLSTPLISGGKQKAGQFWRSKRYIWFRQCCLYIQWQSLFSFRPTMQDPFILFQSLSSITGTRHVLSSLVVWKEGGGITRRRRRKTRTQTCRPDRNSERMCPECCVPAIWQSADSNLMLGAERRQKDSEVRDYFRGLWLQKMFSYKIDFVPSGEFY